MGVAEPLGRNDVGVDALRGQIGDDIAGPARGKIDVVLDARLLQRGADRLVVGVAVDDDLGVLQILQLRDVLIERLLAVSAELVAPLRKQNIAGDGPFLLPLHLGNFGLLRRRQSPRLLQLLALLFICALRYASGQQQRGKRDDTRCASQIYSHRSVSHWITSTGVKLAGVANLDRGSSANYAESVKICRAIKSASGTATRWPTGVADKRPDTPRQNATAAEAESTGELRGMATTGASCAWRRPAAYRRSRIGRASARNEG